MKRPLVVRRFRMLGRRVQLLLMLAVIATAVGAVAVSGASFVSASSNLVNASTTARGGDKMTINDGNNKSTVAGTVLPTSPSVMIKDASGNVVSGLTVTFAVVTGGGSITGATTDITGDDGIAEVSGWKLGSTPGTNTLTASCAGIANPQTLTFTATGTSGQAVSIALNGGNNQNAVAGNPVLINPSVKVSDAGGNGVPNTSVTFAVTSGGGSIVGGVATVTTNSSGVATIAGWKLGPTVGTNTMTATSGTLSGSPVLFTATGTVGPAAKMTLNDGNGQTVHAGTNVNIRPSVKITDANNNVVSGAAVTFTPAAGSGSVTGSPATTDPSGIATLGSWTLGAVVGPDSLTATSGSLTPVTFTATGIVGSPTTISLTSGNNQSATAGSAVGPLVVRVTDALNYGVQGVAVTFAAAPGSGTVTGGSVLTDANGYASPAGWTLGTTVGTNTLTATSPGLTNSPITFTATGTVGAPTKYVVSSSSYGPAAGSPVTITAQLADQYGNAVAQSGIVVTFGKNGSGGSLPVPPTATTGANGAATIVFTTGTAQNTPYTITATSSTPARTGTSPTITTTAAVPARMALNAGNNQSATVNTAVATAPSVIVYDAYNNVVPNVVVTFAVASGGGSITTASATTNASGIATCGSWTLGTTAGANTLTASYGSITGSPVTFTATGTAGAATKYIVTASSYSPAVRSTITLTAQLVDQYNNPVATSGIPVTWSRTGTGGAFGATTTNTNGSGIATTTYRVSRTVGRVYVFTARSTSGGTRTGSSATVTTVAGAPTQMALYAGNNQTATVGTAVATAPSVRVRDVYGNNCANVVVTFTVTAGGGTITTASATTNASGIATCGAWTLGTKVGANTLTATRAGLTGSPVTFTATGTVGAASKISLNAGNTQTATAGTAVTTAPSVLVTDAYNNPVSGIAVTFAVASGGGTITGAAATTGATGIATVASWTLGTAAGANTLTATRTGLTGSPVTFTATGVAGAATRYVVTSSSYNPVAGTAVTITAQLADQYNNPVATSGISVTFTRTPASGTLGTPNPATTGASGVATVTFTTQATVGLVYTVTATSTLPSGRTGVSPTITTR